MAKLPNGEYAVVPLEKLTEYALNTEHPTERHKARVFKAALGLTVENAEFLQMTLQSAAASLDAVAEDPTVYGDRYVIDFKVTTESGTATIRSAWMIRRDEDVPRLTTCYVKED